MKLEFCEKEANIIQIMSHPGHQCVNDFPINAGEAEQVVTSYPKFNKIPSRIEPFLFRDFEMHDLLKLVLDKQYQVVQVYALPGLGKSSLIRNVANHLSERKIFADGILFLRANKDDTLLDCVKHIINEMQTVYT